MGIEDGFRGKAGERRLAALKANPEKFKSMFGGTVEGLTPRTSLDQTPAGYADTRSRDRVKPGVKTEQETAVDYYYGIYKAKQRKEAEEKERARQEKELAEQRRKQAAVKAKLQEEWDRKDAEVRARREQWRIESDREALAKHKAEQAERIERTLLATEITNTLDRATSEEVTAVVARIKQQGLERLPSMYRYELDRLRSEREEK